MSIQVSNNNSTNIYTGNNKVKEVWDGDKKIFPKRIELIKNGKIQVDHRIYSYGNKGSWYQRNDYLELRVNNGITNKVYNNIFIIFNEKINWYEYRRIYVKWANGASRARGFLNRITSDYNITMNNINGSLAPNTNTFTSIDINTYTQPNYTINEDYLDIINQHDNKYPYYFIALFRNDNNYAYQSNPSIAYIYDLYLE